MTEAGRSVNALTRDVIGAAIRVHRELGPGLLERVYVECLHDVLREEGVAAGREVTVPVRFEGEPLDARYRIDLLVEDRVVVEAKACEELNPVHRAQILTYLRAADADVGLLMNFHSAKMIDGVHRFVG
jgi:GxxExxY protein